MSRVHQKTPHHEFNRTLEASNGETAIHNVNHPLVLPYPQGCLEWCKNGLILSAGGGGPTRSGKPNGFEILQFALDSDNSFSLSRHSWYKTGLDIVYCIRQHPLYLYQFIAAIGNNLFIIEILPSFSPEKNNAFKWDWKTELKTIAHRANIERTPLPGIDEDVMWVNSVAISSNGKLIASGGTDGIVRIWKYDFVDPNNKLCIDNEINITQKHFELLPQKKEIPMIERLLFYKSKYLSICNREFACYIWNIEEKRMETVLMDNKKDLIFRDSVFICDNEKTFCICAVNGVRKSRKSRDPLSYLYQYYIPKQDDDDIKWYRTHYSKIIRAAVIRMIADTKTRNIITLHSNGVICVNNAINLHKLYQLKNVGMFFTDIAISPNLYGKKENNYTEYLLTSFGDSITIKPIPLKPCKDKRDSTHNYLYILSIVILILSISIPFFY